MYLPRDLLIDGGAMNLKTPRYVFGACLLLAASGGWVHAERYSNGRSTASFGVSFTVQSTCIVTSELPLNALAIDGAPSGVALRSLIRTSCSASTPFNIGFNAGSVAGAATATVYF